MFGSNRNKPKQDLFRWKFRFVSVYFGVSNLYRNNQDRQNCFKTNRNKPIFSEKYQNMLSIKLFRLVFCLFRFNLSIETLCFEIEAKQPKQTVSKQTKTNRNNPEFSEKNTKICSLSHCFDCSSVCLVQSKHLNSLFRYRRETTERNVLFRIHCPSRN